MSQHPLTCRAAVPADHGTITSFQLAMALETEKLKLDPAACALGVRGVFEEPHRGRYFVCEKDGSVVGSLLIIPEWSDWRNGTVWWIHSVYVAPMERSRGVYSVLYQHLKKLVEADPSLRGLRLYVDKTNLHAQKVYRKLGMSDEHYQLYEWMKKA